MWASYDEDESIIPGDNLKTRAQDNRDCTKEHPPGVLEHLEVELDFPGNHLERIEDGCIKKPVNDGYEKRHLVLLLTRKYEEVWNLGGGEIMDVFREAVLGM